MNAYAVISEFNPFHNGHAYLVRSVKELDTHAAVVAVMSGSLVQRGDVAVIDKYARAEAAVLSGVDLVLELPAPWCFSGAEFFALGGVAVADGIGVCDSLVFGSEVGDIVSLLECDMRSSSDEYLRAVEKLRNTNREKGAAAVRAEAYCKLYGLTDIFNGSNNLLALAYLGALKKLSSSLTPTTIKRVGREYNNAELAGICSATAIRSAIERGDHGLSSFMPDDSERILKRELDAGRYYRLSCLDNAVLAVLRASSPKRLSEYMEMSGGIAERLASKALTSTSIHELVTSGKSKRYSESKIRRAILSSLLEVRREDVLVPPLFTFVLASNEVGRKLLARARKTSSIEILSKLSDSKYLSCEAKAQFELHMRAERLCELCCAAKPRKVGAFLLDRNK